MPINSLEFKTRATEELDKALVQRSVTGMFADNNLREKFVGAKTVLIPEVDMQALGDYDRDEGFVGGAVTVTNQPYTLSMDRGRYFQIDKEDADETGIPSLLGKISGEFVRTKVIPEMDAYVMSKLAGVANTANKTVSGAPATEALKMLKNAIFAVQDEVGYDEELVAFVDGAFWAALQSTTDITRYLSVGDFKRGEINTKVTKLDGVSIIPVASGRMKTGYVFNDGVTDGQKEGGFVPAEGAKSIGLLVLPKKAAHLIKKTEEVRTFDPNTNQKATAWKMDYRVYYDVFVKKSYSKSICGYFY
ncbi:MAG: hypothetical protein IJB36_03985 [Clostridia bacterium]|nr:hypothetical protein [Clostridia bacterium]